MEGSPESIQSLGRDVEKYREVARIHLQLRSLSTPEEFYGFLPSYPCAQELGVNWY